MKFFLQWILFDDDDPGWTVKIYALFLTTHLSIRTPEDSDWKMRQFSPLSKGSQFMSLASKNISASKKGWCINLLQAENKIVSLDLNHDGPNVWSKYFKTIILYFWVASLYCLLCRCWSKHDTIWISRKCHNSLATNWQITRWPPCRLVFEIEIDKLNDQKPLQEKWMKTANRISCV